MTRVKMTRMTGRYRPIRKIALLTQYSGTLLSLKENLSNFPVKQITQIREHMHADTKKNVLELISILRNLERVDILDRPAKKRFYTNVIVHCRDDV